MAILFLDLSLCAVCVAAPFLPLVLVPVTCLLLIALRGLIVRAITWHHWLPVLSLLLSSLYIYFGQVHFYTLALPAVLMAVVNALLCAAMPMELSLPAPSGRYNVARTCIPVHTKAGHGFDVTVYYPTLKATPSVSAFQMMHDS